MTFANPVGAWALLALAAVLAIHALQRRRRSIRVSGLFLLAGAAPPARGGRWIERLRRSRSLWLQLASAALFTWLLLEPRLLREDSTQRVIVVLDSSASMSAFRDRAVAALRRKLPPLAVEAAHTEWLLIETLPGRPRLHAGSALEPVLAALAGWDPTAGSHDPAPALADARRLAGSGGRVVLVTDHAVQTGPGVQRLAVGTPLDNVGFAGLAVEEQDQGEQSWRALVKSHARAVERRRLHIDLDGARRELEPLELQPGELRWIRGTFPTGTSGFDLVLERDDFALDDRLPVVRPARRPLAVFADATAVEDELVVRLLDSLDALERVPDAGLAALEIRFGDAAPTRAPRAIVFAPGRDAIAPGPIIGERHPLVDGLSWRGLLLGPAGGLRLAERDRVLVWRGADPLVALRRAPGDRRELRIGLDSRSSTAARHPALPLLLHRFAAAARQASSGLERRNLETHQLLSVSATADAPPLELVATGASRLPAGREPRAPARPGRFQARRGDELVLDAAAHFADVREADLRGSASLDELSSGRSARLAAASRPDPLAPLWLLLAGALMALDWAGAGRRT